MEQYVMNLKKEKNKIEFFYLNLIFFCLKVISYIFIFFLIKKKIYKIYVRN